MVLTTILAVIIASSTTIGFYNFFTATRLKEGKPNEIPYVSILIPARNEENNIINCLNHIQKQDYNHYEVIVCDDDSSDNTFKVASSCHSVKVIKGKPLPKDWTGKNWACHQLTNEAKGELYLFIDADVLLEPKALSSAVALMENKKVSMLSCFPCQKMNHLGEWLIIPLIDWLLLSFIPLNFVYKTEGKRWSIAIGQFLLIKKNSYLKIGGHEEIKNTITEDTELALNLKKAKEKIITVRSLGLVNCHMYNNFKESLAGFSRSFYLGSHLRPVTYLLCLIGFSLLFFLPLALFIIDSNLLYLLIPLLLQRIATSILACQNVIINLFLLPIHGVMTIYTGSRSIYDTLNNRIIWKERPLLSKIGKPKI